MATALLKLAAALAACLSLSGCSQDKGKKNELLVSAAASLTDSFAQIGDMFEANNPGLSVRFNFGGSNLLEKQIERGAPVDIFASAAQIQMDRLQGKGAILEETRRDFAGNSIVLIVPPDADADSLSFEALKDQKIERIALGNEGVPAGMYGREVLQALGLWDSLQPKLIFAENARQVLHYVSRGETGAGLVYSTDARISRNVRVVARGQREWHTKIAYPIAVLKRSQNITLAKRFVEFVTGSESRKVLMKYGFTPGS